MRDTIERPEGIEVGAVKLVGTNGIKIVNDILELLDNPILSKKNVEKSS